MKALSTWRIGPTTTSPSEPNTALDARLGFHFPVTFVFNGLSFRFLRFEPINKDYMIARAPFAIVPSKKLNRRND
jgi:hypothetical protein